MKSFKLTYVFGLFFLMGLLTSCDSNSNIEKWNIIEIDELTGEVSYDSKHYNLLGGRSYNIKDNESIDLTISDLKDQFGDPDSLNLLNSIIDNMTNINNKWLYIDPYNPKFSNNKDSVRRSEKGLIQLLKNNMLENKRGIEDKYGNKKPKVSIIEEFEWLLLPLVSPHYHMGDFSEEKQTYINKPDLDDTTDLQFSHEELVSMNFSKKIVCKGCQKLIKIRKILGDYAYYTTQKEWINSMISKHPNNYDWIFKSSNYLYDNVPYIKPRRGYGNHFSDDLNQGIRYVFLLKEDKPNQYSEFVRGNTTGFFDVIESSEDSQKKSFKTSKTIFKINKSSENEIVQLLNNSNWDYGGLGSIRFNLDKTFSYSTKMFGGFTKTGTWGISKTGIDGLNTSGDIYTYPTRSTNGQGMNRSWYTLISKNKLKLRDGEGKTVYKKR